jgi:ankyrin repeat protein
MWNPAEGTGYEQPPVVHPLDVLFIPNGEADMQRIVDLAQAKMKREEYLAADFTLAKVVERQDDLRDTGLTSVDEIIAKEAAGELDLMGELVERALLAARSSNLETLEIMLDDHHVDVDSCDKKGNTLLLLASQQGDRRIVKYLLRRGANINKTNHAGNSVLHYCFEYQNTDLAEYLKTKGADDGITNGMGCTCYEGLTSGEVDGI